MLHFKPHLYLCKVAVTQRVLLFVSLTIPDNMELQGMNITYDGTDQGISINLTPIGKNTGETNQINLVVPIAAGMMRAIVRVNELEHHIGFSISFNQKELNTHLLEEKLLGESSGMVTNGHGLEEVDEIALRKLAKDYPSLLRIIDPALLHEKPKSRSTENGVDPDLVNEKE